MRKRYPGAFTLALLVMFFYGCKTTENIVAKYSVKDHFMVDKYEVGVLEYESPSYLLWGFPIYLNGQKIRTYYCQLQETSEYDKQKEAQPQFSQGAKTALVHTKEVILVEETTDKKCNTIKEYKNTTPINYETVKEDIIKILKNE